MGGSALLISLLIWVLSFGAALFGIWIWPRLPVSHRTRESRDLVNAAALMVSTLTALALGLLLSVADGSFDDSESHVRLTASNLMRMDHMLRLYGPEVEESRKLIRSYAEALLRDIDPPDGRAAGFEDVATLDLLAKAESEVAMLTPSNSSERWLQPHILDVADRTIQEYFLLVKNRLGSLPSAVVLLLIVWLVLLFAAYGLLAPPHSTSLLVLFLTSGAAAGAVFLILEMESPVDGFVHLSSEPLQHAIEVMDRPYEAN